MKTMLLKHIAARTFEMPKNHFMNGETNHWVLHCILSATLKTFSYSAKKYIRLRGLC